MALGPDVAFRLNSGQSIPLIALGVYKAKGEECYDAVYAALDAGYRHIDSARMYGNEAEVGDAIRHWINQNNAQRTDIFFTTKLVDSDHGFENTKKAIDQSLEQSGLGYIDLYLIHSPNPGKEKRLASWKAICEAVNEGKIRSAGVSNYGVHHLQELLDSEPDVLPSVNQVELHPYLLRKDICRFCAHHGIQMEAYSPLTRGQKLDAPELKEIASHYSKSTAQLLIRFSLQKGWITLPKSVTRERIISNFDVFDFGISDADMSALEALDCYGVTGWDPTRSA